MKDLAGKWHVSIEDQNGDVTLPGIIQMQGYGEEINEKTEFMSGLHNPFWYEREEYAYGRDDGFKVPFLAQPVRVFRGEAVYTKNFTLDEEAELILYIELTRWKVTAYIDGRKAGEKTALFTPFAFPLGLVAAGEHELKVVVDNSMQYPYRPDGHGVSDALGATWNGMGGEIVLLTPAEYEAKEAAKKAYAEAHPVSVEVKDCRFIVNGRAEYMRGVHFGGDYPHTGMPDTTPEFWDHIMDTVKGWGFNFIRCHSYCPPDAAFTAADKAGVFIQVECGMWNVFNEGIPMLDVLKEETVNILKAFGHHPSFILFSSGNEPSGKWYKVLRDWVTFAREEDKKIGYAGRRVYTAESGWFYDVPPTEITGTDYIYFHRSAYGPLPGGVIRNFKGWKGKDYNVSLPGCKLPVISHEMGQWCAYPDFDVIKKFSGYMTPGNYEIFKGCAENRGVLKFDKDFAYCSGRNQVRLLKEDIEANYRTEAIQGFEYLDLHDYLGQGGAFVGILDAFWEGKGYVGPSEIREYVADTVILTRLASYVYKTGDIISSPVELLNYSGKDIEDGVLSAKLVLNDKTAWTSEISGINAKCGGNTKIAELKIPLNEIEGNCAGSLILSIVKNGEKISENRWEISVFAGETTASSDVLYTEDIKEALAALNEGRKVIYSPYLTDTDYECPALGMRNIFWNDQMGPGWSRPLGIVCDDRHPLFKYFPTERSGGWQWEDILDRARGFAIGPEHKNIVRAVDCWNRNQPLSLIFEAKVGKGKLLLVSADLDGTFEDRPAAFALKQALVRYALSDEFEPSESVEVSELTRHIFPVTSGNGIIDSISVKGSNTDIEALFDLNPNNAWEADDIKEFPVELELHLKKKVKVTGLQILPPQNDRDFIGCIKDYSVKVAGREIASGRMKNRLLGEITDLPATETDTLTVVCKSVYGSGIATRWDENSEGWFKTTAEEKKVLSIAGLQIRFEGDFEAERGNRRFWAGETVHKHKEIEA